MIHYHGLPITPEHACTSTISAGHAFVSFAHPEQLHLASALCSSFALDNGAYTQWKRGVAMKSWDVYYQWAAGLQHHPGCDFAVIPDIIEGSEEENDALLFACPLSPSFGAPVWHMHESLSRLTRLVSAYTRVCLGSSAQFSVVGTAKWWTRMHEAMGACCDAHGRPLARLHGLRMLDPAIFTRLPLSSADSTNIARNIGLDMSWTGTYQPLSKPVRAHVMRTRIESYNAPPIYTGQVAIENDSFGILV